MRAIRGVVSERRRAELWKSISALNFKRLWNYALPLLVSRTESIAGFPGPPVGASVHCSGVFSDASSSFRVFNTTNGWSSDSISFIDAKTKQRVREKLERIAQRGR